jgi:hypothetical protein
MPSEGDRLSSGLHGLDDATGIPSLSVNEGVSGLSSHSQSKVSGQVVLAGLVLIIAAGAIYGMRFVGLNAGFGGEDVKIDYTSQAGSPESAKRYSRVMTELDGSLNAVQFARDDELPAAPFTRPSTATPTATFVFEEPNTEDDLIRMARMAEEQLRLQREQRAELLKNELGRLNVQSVMAGGRMPVARINGQPVTIGKFLGSFEVVDIANQSVFITADGMTWELPIGMPARLLD